MLLSSASWPGSRSMSSAAVYISNYNRIKDSRLLRPSELCGIGVSCLQIKLSLRALPFDLALARLFVLLWRNPHLLERSDAGQNRTADPGAKSPLNRSVGCNHFQPRVRWRTMLQIAIQALWESLRKTHKRISLNAKGRRNYTLMEGALTWSNVFPPVITTDPYSDKRTSASHMPTLVWANWPAPNMVWSNRLSANL